MLKFSGSPRRGTVATDGTEAGNTCRQPVRRGGRATAAARGGEGEAGGGRRTPAPYYLPRPPHARARAQPARPGHRGLRRGPTLARLPRFISTGLDPPAAPLRRARIGSRGTPRRPAGRRRSGRPRGAEGGGEGAETEGGEADAGSEPRRSPLRGARPRREPGQTSRARAARRRSQTEERAAARVAGEERHRGKVRRRPARAPGPTRCCCPVRADVRVLSRTTHAHNTPRRAPHARPPPGHPRSHLFTLRPYAHRAAAASTKAAAAGAAAAAATAAADPRHRDPPPDTQRESLPHVDPSRPARGGTTPGRTRPTPPTPRRLDLTEFPTGHGQGNGGGAGEWEEGAPTRARLARAGTEEQGGRGPAGRGAGGRARDARGRGATAARPPRDDDARTRLNLGRRRARAGALRTNSQPRDTPSLAGRGGGGD
ncbi:hypothetical protein ACRRTK_024817 [Alexandromys fortis]